MTETEKRRLTKYALATYLSILAVFFFGFKMTTSIAFSAIFVISYGATRQSCLVYSLHRILAQVVGVACGGLLYALITSEYAAFLPESQRMALAMTLGLVAVLALKYKLHLDIAEFTMFTPVFLVLLMTPGNARYPVLRVVYCTIGILIGIAVNFLVFPCPASRWAGLESKLRREDRLLEQVMADFTPELSLTAAGREMLEEIAALGLDIDQALQDMAAREKAGRVSAPEGSALWSGRHRLNSACSRMVRQISALSQGVLAEDRREYIRAAALGLFATHQSLAARSGRPPEQAVFALPGVEEEMHDLLLCESEIITYYRHIAAVLNGCTPDETRALSQTGPF